MPLKHWAGIVLLVVSCVIASEARAGGQIECTSNNYRYTYCRADTGNRVKLTSQQSKTACRQGQNWGYDARGIWVDDGCGAIFEYGYGKRPDNRRKDKTGDIVAGVAAVAILGAILSSDKSDRRPDENWGGDRVPGWALGRFGGRDYQYGGDLSIEIDRGGRLSGYYDGDRRIDGQVDGDGVYIGNRHYDARPTSDGFQLMDERGRVAIDFYRSGGGRR